MQMIMVRNNILMFLGARSCWLDFMPPRDPLNL
jgi:hypothetical protein